MANWRTGARVSSIWGEQVLEVRNNLRALPGTKLAAHLSRDVPSLESDGVQLNRREETECLSLYLMLREGVL